MIRRLLRILGVFGVAALVMPAPCQEQQRRTTVVEADSSARPSITPGGVITAGAFGAFATVATGSWIEIYGTNLASGTRSWTAADFTGSTAPTSLSGTTVTVGGQPAFIAYVSPTQVNAQVPTDIGSGQYGVVVTTDAGASDPVSVQVYSVVPGLLAPSSFTIGGKQYVAALFPDSVTFALPPGAIPGVPSRRAQPGDILTFYGIGFGAVTPDTPAGQIAAGMSVLQTQPFHILFGPNAADNQYYGLAPGAVGLYQFNVVVPDVTTNDALPLTFTVGPTPMFGVTGTQSLYIAVQNNTQIQGLTLSANSVIGGSSVQATVTLSAVAKAGGVTVSLSSDSAAASVPASVTIPAGSATAHFTVSTVAVSSSQTATLTATYDGSSTQATLTVNPYVPRPNITSVNSLVVPAGSNQTLVISGTNLAAVTAVKFSPPTGITVNSISTAATQVVASITIASTLPTGPLELSVSSPGGTSGATGMMVIQAPAGHGTYDGLWDGFTSQNLPISILITGDNIRAYAYALNFTGGGYSCPSGVISFRSNMALPISAASFTSSSISGTFQSLTQAGGVASWTLSLSGCSGSGSFVWNVTKQ